MARSQNPLPSEVVNVTINAQTSWYLDRLVEQGLYGNNRSEAAKILIYDHCKLLIAKNELPRAPEIPAKSIKNSDK